MLNRTHLSILMLNRTSVYSPQYTNAEQDLSIPQYTHLSILMPNRTSVYLSILMPNRTSVYLSILMPNRTSVYSPQYTNAEHTVY